MAEDKKNNEVESGKVCNSNGDNRDADFKALDTEMATGNKKQLDAAQLVDKVNKLEAELGQVKEESRKNREDYLRALADLENYKKRAMRDRSDLLKYQGEQVLFDIISVADDFERAAEHLDAEPAQLKAGIQMIQKRLLDILSKWEVVGVSRLGETFDPAMFHAISKVAGTTAAPGTIVSELKKAYTYKDKLLRVGEAVVAAEAEQNGATGEAQAGDNSSSPEPDSEQ